MSGLRWQSCGLLVAALTALMFPSAAFAQERVVVFSGPDSELGYQVIDELFAEGFQPIPVIEQRSPWAVLDAYSTWRDARSLVVVEEGSTDPKVYTFHPERGAEEHRLLPAPLPSAESRVVALRVVELLRQALRELDNPVSEPGSLAAIPGLREESAPVPDPPEAPSEKPPATKEPVVILGVQGAARVTDGGLGATGHLEAHGSFRIWKQLRAWVSALVPLHASEVVEPEGKVDIWTGQLSAGISWGLLPASSPWHWSLGIGGGVGVTWYDASAGTGLVGRADSLTTPLVEGRTTVSYRFNRYLSAGLTVSIGTLIPDHEIVFVDRKVVTWGAPWGWLGIGVDGLVP